MDKETYDILTSITEIMAFVFIGGMIILIFLTYRPKKKKTTGEFQVMATVLRKEVYLVANPANKMNSTYHSYEVVFLMDDEEKVFVVNSFFYNVLEVGDKGILEYTKERDIISFADKIKKITPIP
ncbi:hypothetical protein M2475_001952 [Breznakia sp. PF5-3]|uniref:DUF2500 family protein n=1 Tax=unclassified Breznakia TaxID=2623764 RepID=UPI00240698A8|nr:MULTISPECIES: DUF2500 family protein [unclassified Breznakia]MDL2276057.1 DUF2500 domain-containing protein [Breznakia sp. OttesenSCG-928-G09]MDF9825506.1 hypothetical protein [Breznakia sp. PM6-1]MDF9836372.1 hypothetical protein [Breznakia sp. PF5-3]MDF9837488.1 hypothetical protein [Breznakia sp. PFB2-8]MDF9859449.1 hypothetical protein [Breznakia sp. PH5-24]